MGHYASEMMCNVCGKIPCWCPRPPNTEPEMWMVDHDLTVMQVKVHDKKYEYRDNGRFAVPGNPYLRRYNSKLFATKEKAMEHRIVVANDQVEAALEHANKANRKYTNLVEKRDAFRRAISS